jgi:hypothetical protein
LTLNANAVRGTGISPLLVFFDATGTTDTSIGANRTAFQDVTYTWNFGDAGTSGTDTWAYGSNPGHNSRNSATGGVAAHLYVTPGADAAYTVSVTADDGTNSASCQLGVTAYDPVGPHGFAGRKTTCVSASGTSSPGSGGCPAGAATLHTSSFNTALGSAHFGSGKRVLLKCGDTFTGDDATLSGVTWSVGAYGGCEGTQTNRPILRDSSTVGQLTIAAASTGDGRIADLDLEGNGTAGYAVEQGSGNGITYQITMSNLYSNGNDANYAWGQGAQWGIVGSVATGMRTKISVYGNFSGNNPSQWTGNLFNNNNYQALLGNFFNGGGGSGSDGEEVVRFSSCQYCVIENNVSENANSVGAVLKLQESNASRTPFTWVGLYNQYIEISDNWFGGQSGGQLVETSPENSSYDERLRYIVFERNILAPNNNIGTAMIVSAQYETVRDNVFYLASGQSHPAGYILQVGTRGNIPAYPTQYIEVYNNTCYLLSVSVSQHCVNFSGQVPLTLAGNNSWAKNNLLYDTYGSAATVNDQGTGNTIGNNTATPANNPNITNGSGSFKILSDFKPTANYIGGGSVPVLTDALGMPWGPVWDLGAVHH